MSIRCRVCGDEMPKDRKGWEQVCPTCRGKGHEELAKPRHTEEQLDALIGKIRES